MSFLRLTLPELPPTIGSLINDGYWALYVVEDAAFPYLLMTDKGVLYSVAEGGIVGERDLEGASLRDFKIKTFALIEGLPPSWRSLGDSVR